MPAVCVPSKHAGRPVANAAGRTTKQAGGANKTRTVPDSHQQTKRILEEDAKVELEQYHDKLASIRLTARQAAGEQARKASDQAKRQREKENAEAEAELHKTKQAVLCKLLGQLAALETAGSNKSSSGTKKQKLTTGGKNFSSHPEGATHIVISDPVVCQCGNDRIFCKDPCCMKLYCEQCTQMGKGKEENFEFCEAGNRGRCCRNKAGPYYASHFDRYLDRCGACGTVGCGLSSCEDCLEPFCADCLCDQCQGYCEDCCQDSVHRFVL